MIATVDTICDELATALSDIDFSLSWGVDVPFEIKTQSLPDFDLIEAIDTAQIRISAYPNTESKRIDRETIETDHKVGIAIVKKLKMTDGAIDGTEFRKLKMLAESIREWCWNVLRATYGIKVVRVDFPAWFDFEKAKAGIFLTVIQPVFRLGSDSVLILAVNPDPPVPGIE